MTKKPNIPQSKAGPMHVLPGGRPGKDANPQVLAQRAREAFRSGRLWEAEEIARNLLAKNPSFPPAMAAMGLVASQTGRIDFAIQLLEKSTSAIPEDREGLNALANLYRTVNRIEEAEAIWLRMLKQQPMSAELHNSLGICCLSRDRADEALALFDKAIALGPPRAVYHHNRGTALQRMRRTQEAADAFRTAIEISPKVPDSYIALAYLFIGRLQYKAAIEGFKKAYELEPNTSRGNVQMAQALLEDERPGEALPYLERAVDLNPRSGEAVGMLGSLLQQLGRFEEAEVMLNKAIRIQPDLAAAYAGLAAGKKFKKEDRPFVDGMISQLDKFGPEALESMAYAIAKALDDMKDYETAMRYFDIANACAEKRLNAMGHGLIRDKFIRFFDAMIETFTPEYFEKVRSFGSESQTPIFVLGMIRSGTTLTEQIVSSHREVGAAGEVRYWVERGRDPGDLLPWLPDGNSAKIVEAEYLAELHARAPEAQRVTDKMPLNFMSLGPIHTVFPRAKIIHCRRSPVDNCLSIYMTRYRLSPEYAHNRENIVFMYRLYEKLMAHWRAVLPPDLFLEVQYEDLVSDPETHTRRIIDFLGLEWDEACLHHDRNEKAIRTPSLWQARQPIYKTSAEKWRRYEPWLGAFSELLTA
jgi:tetratricopeptide (TPR) repeat protein